MGNQAPDEVERLIEQLSNAKWASREAEEACRALGWAGDPRAVEPLIERLTNNSPNVRKAACEALGRIGDPRAVGPLIQRLTEDRRSPVYDVARRALQEMHGDRAVGAFIEHLGDPNVEVRDLVAGALAHIGYPAAVEPLIQRLRDPDWRVRETACKAVARMGQSQAVQPRCLRHQRPEVRASACTALGRAGNSRAVPRLLNLLAAETRPDTRSAAREALQSILRTPTDSVPDIAWGVNRIFQGHEEAEGDLFCRECWTRFTIRTRKLSSSFPVRWLECRVCGRAVLNELTGTVKGAKQVVAVLDTKTREFDYCAGRVRINWLKARKLFDFDRVEIVHASDDDVMRLCVQVGNDTDDFRRTRYKSIPVMIHADCRLEEDTLRNLKSLFGDVILEERKGALET